ncbi:MAG: general secretion pathway protein GspK [Deltaproteobacteria bacterium]|nr:general secretion pathway protein GspK [Deltaproteobacteria bacterium]
MSKCSKKNEKGAALVLTLVILVVLTAMVTEFAYGVYMTNASLYNWRDSQRLSLVASSGLTLTVKNIVEVEKLNPYTYPGKAELGLGGIVGDFNGAVGIRVEDENSKFNINSIVWPNGALNDRSYQSFRKLLVVLGVDESVADRVADRIDTDTDERLPGSEDGAKNGYFESPSELFLIEAVSRQDCEKLLPYLTVYGLEGPASDTVNINTASVPVIMSLGEDITEDLAQRVVSYRDLLPFESPGELTKVAGFEGALGQSLMGRISVKAVNFSITSEAEENGVKRSVSAVVALRGASALVRYWMER